MTAHRPCCCTLLLVCLVAASLLLMAASAEGAGRPMHQRRRLAQAYATATADASNGASVSADSRATSTGSPTSSVVKASGSGPVTVNCQQQAANGQQLSKECSQPGGAKCGKFWYDSPGCSKGARITATDAEGCKWGWENGKSCAIRS